MDWISPPPQFLGLKEIVQIPWFNTFFATWNPDQATVFFCLWHLIKIIGLQNTLIDFVFITKNCCRFTQFHLKQYFQFPKISVIQWLTIPGPSEAQNSTVTKFTKKNYISIGNQERQKNIRLCWLYQMGFSHTYFLIWCPFNELLLHLV